jgi:hypothetical protein
MSNRELGALFCCTHFDIARKLQEVRTLFLKSSFMCRHFGFGHVTRDELITQHTSSFADAFFGDSGKKAIVILDGTFQDLITYKHIFITYDVCLFL